MEGDWDWISSNNQHLLAAINPLIQAFWSNSWPHLCRGVDCSRLSQMPKTYRWYPSTAGLMLLSGVASPDTLVHTPFHCLLVARTSENVRNLSGSLAMSSIKNQSFRVVSCGIPMCGRKNAEVLTGGCCSDECQELPEGLIVKWLGHLLLIDKIVHCKLLLVGDTISKWTSVTFVSQLEL